MKTPLRIVGQAPFLFRLTRQRSGSVAIEFSLVAGILLLSILAIIEFGLIEFSSMVVESATTQAVRTASLGGSGPANLAIPGCTTAKDIPGFIREYIRCKAGGVMDVSRLVITTDQNTPPEKLVPERCVSGGVCSVNCDATTCECPGKGPYLETNGFPGCQGANAAALDNGGAGDIRTYRVIYPWRIQTPIMKPFFQDNNNGEIYIISNAVVKNEPF